MQKYTRLALQTFVERTEEMLDFRFVRSMMEGSGYKISVDGMGLTIERRGADNEAIHAFCNIFRQLVQNNDLVALCNMANLNDRALSSKWVDGFTFHRGCVNSYLDQRPLNHTYKLVSRSDPRQSKELTRRDIMELCLYGRFSHNNPQKRTLFMEIQQTPNVEVYLNEFTVILVDVLRHIVRIAELAREELR